MEKLIKKGKTLAREIRDRRKAANRWEEIRQSRNPDFANTREASPSSYELESGEPQKWNKVLVIGDSHSLVLDDCTVDSSGVVNQGYLFRSFYIPGLTAPKVFSTKTGLNSGFQAALRAGGALASDSTGIFPFYLSESLVDRNVAIAKREPRICPNVLVTCGDIDLRAKITKRFKEEDFELPFKTPYDKPDTNVREKGNFTFVDAVLERYAPLIEGLVYLHSQGFRNLWLQGMCPPTRNDAKFSEINGYECSLEQRYRVAYAVNHLLKWSCEKAGILFLDLWEETTDPDNYLSAQFHLDHVHLSSKVAQVASLSICKGLAERRVWRGTHHANYQAVKVKAQAEASQLSSEWPNGVQSEFSQKFLLTTQIAPETVKQFIDGLEFDQDVGNRNVRYDWEGNTAYALSDHIKGVKPQDWWLELAKDTLYKDSTKSFIEACMGSRFVVYNVRPFLSLQHNDKEAGPQKFHLDGTPDGMLRGILYLVDVTKDNGAFSYQDLNGDEQSVEAPAGTLIVFDANQLWHRGTPPRTGNRKVIDLVFGPAWSGDQPKVICNSSNNWPSDPFSYSLDEMQVLPVEAS